MDREFPTVYTVLVSAAALFLTSQVLSGLVAVLDRILAWMSMATAITGSFIADTASAVLIAPVAAPANTQANHHD
jgi:hypothetical protein